MARLRARGNLTCFYCGKRSSIKYDGVVRDFLCLNCDATNYLDEHGDITDPPVAQTANPVEPTQYATARSLSPQLAAPSSSSSESIFCAKCLKNQHLFTSSLAQYLPDDPDHPEYERLEKNYYNFRQKLERLYPQICQECEPKVLAQVDRAGYTARTDHLRRMMDKSRQQRVTPKRRSALDSIDWVGWCLWMGGLALQLLWHLVIVSDSLAAATPGPIRDPDEVPSWLSPVLLRLAGHLPRSQLLMSWSIAASAFSIWWNPRFVQFYRGFSKHVLGLSQWYLFQVLVVVTRVGGRRVTELAASSGVSRTAQLSLHGLISLATVVSYVKARNLVHIDTTPLFKTTTSPMPSPLRATPSEKPVRREEPQSMASMLDEIMQQPTTSNPSPVMEIPTRPSRSPTGHLSPVPRFQTITPMIPSRGMSSLGLAESPTPVHYSEEMDWSPTQEKQSKHRAFNDFGPPGREKQGFNQSPTNVEAGAFWYKVPPAPKPPLHKLMNPTKPVIREKPVEKEPTFFSSRKPFRNDEEVSSAPKPKVAFAQPAFFAEQATTSTNSNDPRNTLVDLLNSSFTIKGSDEPDDDSAPLGAREHPIELRLNVVGKAQSGSFVDVLLILASVCMWGYAMYGEGLTLPHAGHPPQQRVLPREDFMLDDVLTSPEEDFRPQGDLSTPLVRTMMISALVLAMIATCHMTFLAVSAFQTQRNPSSLLTLHTSISLCVFAGCGALLFNVWTVARPDVLAELFTPGLATLSVILAQATAAFCTTW